MKNNYYYLYDLYESFYKDVKINATPVKIRQAVEMHLYLYDMKPDRYMLGYNSISLQVLRLNDKHYNAYLLKQYNEQSKLAEIVNNLISLPNSKLNKKIMKRKGYITNENK